MFRLRRSRWRRALVAAFAPYLFLSMFVDFVHVHPLIGADDAQGSTSGATLTPHSATAPVRSCPVCQWLRADTGLQTPIASAITTDLLAAGVVPDVSPRHAQSIVLAHDLRGPPRQLFV